MTLPRSIRDTVHTELIVKKSRFIVTLTPVKSSEDFSALVTTLKKQYWDARHNCTAAVIGTYAEFQRSSDDGEPAGTAGLPMLEVLRKQNVSDVGVVVTRYFGGILLGSGGLIRAYSQSVSLALEQACFVSRQLLQTWDLPTDYDLVGKVENFLHTWFAKHTGFITEISYQTRPIIRCCSPVEEVKQILETLATNFSREFEIKLGEIAVYDVPTTTL